MRRAQLRFYMNQMAFDSFEPKRTLESLTEHGFQGFQFTRIPTREELDRCRKLNLGIATSGRINQPEEAGPFAQEAAASGFECATIHLGWGLEDDPAAHFLIEALLNAQDRHKIPLYPETHRATIFQDMWRSVQFVQQFPELRFNGDFSHWYAGQEMVYGGFATKLAFIQPILDRVRFLHGRIANPGCIQVAIEPDSEYVTHFRQLWTRAFQGVLNDPRATTICFTPELLAPDIYYARTFQDIEESDRWQQSLLLNEIAQQCFASAQSS